MAGQVRAAALHALHALEKEKTWSEQAVKKEIAEKGLERRDAALLTSLVYGVLQNRRLLDFYIVQVSGKGMNRFAPVVRDLLRLSFYQALFLERVPNHAVVDEAVALAKRRANPQAAGLVNAVLRKLFTTRDALTPPDASTPSGLAVATSHPDWFVQKMVDCLGLAKAGEFLLSHNRPAPLCARVNTLLADDESVLAELAAAGVEAEAFAGVPHCLVLKKTGDVAALPAWRAGKIQIQDPASQIAVAALGPRPGEHVLDLCSAPGGKAILAAQWMDNKGVVRAFDLYPHRVELILKNAVRMNALILSAETGDGTVLNPALVGSADRVLCDVPCSGMGVIRKKPEIRYKTWEEIQDLPVLQGKILKNAASYLKIHGEMIYSTCSVLTEENEEVVEAFLAENDGYSLCPFDAPLLGRAEKGMATLWPHVHGTDGFFIARIRRNR